MTQTRLEVLDGLRGIAILMVMLLHFWQITWLDFSIPIPGLTIDLNFLATTGMMGVSLFLFISGFCLFHSYSYDRKLASYVYRRAIKILPSYFLCMFAILIFFGAGFSDWRETGWHVLTHMFFIHNWFQDTSSSINGVFWSLGVEIQFYVLFPFLFLLYERRPVLATLLISLAATAYRLLVEKHCTARFDFFLNQLPGFIDFFAYGMLAAKLAEKKRPQLQSTVVALASLSAFLGLLYMAHGTRFAPGISHWQATYRPVLGIVFLILTVSSISAHETWKRMLANRALVFLSVISYNLYLWHQFLGRKLSLARIPEFVGTDPHLDHKWQVAFMLLASSLSIFLAAALTYGFERPLLRARRKSVALQKATQMPEGSAL